MTLCKEFESGICLSFVLASRLLSRNLSCHRSYSAMLCSRFICYFLFYSQALINIFLTNLSRNLKTGGSFSSTLKNTWGQHKRRAFHEQIWEGCGKGYVKLCCRYTNGYARAEGISKKLYQENQFLHQWFRHLPAALESKNGYCPNCKWSSLLLVWK